MSTALVHHETRESFNSRQLAVLERDWLPAYVMFTFAPKSAYSQ